MNGGTGMKDTRLKIFLRHGSCVHRKPWFPITLLHTDARTRMRTRERTHTHIFTKN